MRYGVYRGPSFDEFSVGIPITNPAYWISEECTDEQIAHVFRSATEEKIPLLEERISCLKEAGEILQEVRRRSCIHLTLHLLLT